MMGRGWPESVVAAAEVCAKAYDVAFNDIMGSSRAAQVVHARAIALYALLMSGGFNRGQLATYFCRHIASVRSSAEYAETLLRQTNGRVLPQELLVRHQEIFNVASSAVRQAGKRGIAYDVLFHGPGFMGLRYVPTFEWELEVDEQEWLDNNPHTAAKVHNGYLLYTDHLAALSELVPVRLLTLAQHECRMYPYVWILEKEL